MKKEITIGIFCDAFFPMTDGVIMVVDNYARRLMKYGNVIVFVPKTNEYYDDSVLPYTVVRCNSIKVPFMDYSLPIPFFSRDFSKKLKNYNLDIVHIHSPFTLGSLGIKYSKKHNIPCVATMHSQFKQDILRIIKSDTIATKLNSKLINIFNKCDQCWAVNQEVANIFYKDYGYKCLPKTMNNATEMLPIKESKNAIKYINKKHQIKANEKVFLFVGRINILKNILFIADSLKAVKEKRPKLKFKMLYVGCGQDEEILRNHIQKLQLENEVVMCGKITDREELAKYYKRADLFLFPSIYDASSIVQIEAASQETPGIFLKGAATAGTITDNVNGFLSEHTVGAYSDKIIEVLENRKLLESVSKNAYLDLYKHWDDAIKEVYDSYVQLINKNNA
ncbi:MAG: glycosyltransferase family 4 protein [Firmicutes bacterium]|nr:glycosyltransferase family 4 protein [Bacillota bacterium]